MKWLKKAVAALLSFSGCSSKREKEQARCGGYSCSCVGTDVCNVVTRGSVHDSIKVKSSKP